MSYTHYWRQSRWTREDREGYAQALPIVRQILHVRHRPLLCRSFGSGGQPEVTDRLVQFNGVEGCEDFMFCNARRQGDYCKTGRLPYDRVVCEVLVVLHAHCLNLKLESDGLVAHKGLLTPTETGWFEALASVRNHYPGLNLRGFARA